MTLPLDSESGAKPTDESSAKVEGIAGSHARRREVVLGGVTAAGVMLTLANRPALAGVNKCTVSAIGSMNPSHVVSSKCGDTPGCWSTTDSNTWIDGAKCNGIAVKYTHSTDLTSIFTLLRSSPFSCQNTQLISTISGSGSCRVRLKNGTKVSLWTATQQSNVTAAVLNDLFYGNRYYSTPIQNVINTFLNNVVTYANANQSSNITSGASMLDNTLSLLNQQGQ